MKYSLFVMAAVMVSACSNFQFKSNLNPSNFTEYYKPSGVKVVTDADIASVPTHSLGLVSGLSCQINENDEIATDVNARTDAKLKAVDMGANAIKFGKCVRLENTPACLVSVTCYADALVINDK